MPMCNVDNSSKQENRFNRGILYFIKEEFIKDNKCLFHINTYCSPFVIQMIKEIIYTLYSLYNTDFKYILPKINRDELINIYIISKGHNPSDFLNYYKMAIINKYAKNTT